MGPEVWLWWLQWFYCSRFTSFHSTHYLFRFHLLYYRQTEGPTGPLIASSNPEYLSANDGKKRTQKGV